MDCLSINWRQGVADLGKLQCSLVAAYIFSPLEHKSKLVQGFSKETRGTPNPSLPLKNGTQ